MRGKSPTENEQMQGMNAWGARSGDDGKSRAFFERPRRVSDYNNRAGSELRRPQTQPPAHARDPQQPLMRLSQSRTPPPVMQNQQKRTLLAVAVALLVILCLLLVFGELPISGASSSRARLRGPLNTVWGESTKDELKLAIVSDMDQGSAVEGSKKPAWRSIFKRGTLKHFHSHDGVMYSIEWEPDENLIGGIGEEGRGMELSELQTWKGQLLSFDDRTGIAYEITKDRRAVARYILTEGDGLQQKGQKTEWATAKDGVLYVGSFGKEYVNSDGTIKNKWNLWVKTIDAGGNIGHEDWADKFEVLRKATKASWPGYMIHEAIRFDEVGRKWVVLPRRVSSDKYDEKLDERRGSNLVMILDEDFTRVERMFSVGPQIPLRGWSTFQFVPGTGNDIIVAVKTEEEENKVTGVSQQRSFVTVFRLSDGRELMPQTQIPGKVKFEGLDFL
jgi:soluble calcium-activated nucleotidase 1